MGKDKKLNFETYEQAAEWFDTHDMADCEALMQPVDFEFDLRKNRDWVELESDIARNARELAKRQNIPTRKLVNQLVREGLVSLQQVCSLTPESFARSSDKGKDFKSKKKSRGPRKEDDKGKKYFGQSAGNKGGGKRGGQKRKR